MDTCSTCSQPEQSMQRFQACRLLTLRRRLLECNRILGDIAHILEHSFNEPIVIATSNIQPIRRSTYEELFTIHAHSQRLLLETHLILEFSFHSFDQSNITNPLRMLSKELRKISCATGFVLRSGLLTAQGTTQTDASSVPCVVNVNLSYDPSLLGHVDYIKILANTTENYIALFSQSVAGFISLLDLEE